jgi:hypothetical protein
MSQLDLVHATVDKVAATMSGCVSFANVKDTRARLWAGGFRPISVKNFDKAPIGKEWGNKARLDPPESIKFDPVSHALNTGILCDGLRAIDLDIDDKELAAQCRSIVVDRFGEAPIRCRQNSPRCLILYRAAEGQPKKVTLAGTRGKVEVLGHGQQFIAFGQHPSKATLEWFPDAPGAATLDTLPAVSEDALLGLLADLAPLIDAPPPRRSNGDDRDHAAAVDDLEADPLRIAAALLEIPNASPKDWEAWNRTGMAVWRSTGGSDMGFHALDAWSKRHPDYDAQETRKRWDHYATSPPNRIGAGTIFHMADEARRQKDAVPVVGPGSNSPDSSGAKHADGGPLRIDGNWWLTRLIERPTPILGELICTTTRGMVGGPTGAGKTHLAMGMAGAIVTGTDFLHWRGSANPLPVLYVDGEMAQDLIFDRMADLYRRLKQPVDFGNFHMLCREDFPSLEGLNTAGGRALLLQRVEDIKPAVVFLDNRMCLLDGDMKENMPWKETMPLALELTRRKTAQVWLDHTGHATDKIYGDKTKEFQMDFVGLLEAMDDDQKSDINIRLKFPKARRRRPETRADFAAVRITLKDDQWAAVPHEGGSASSAGTKNSRLSKGKKPFYEALLAALEAAPATPGTTTRQALAAECVRVGLIAPPYPGETGKERNSRENPIRKALQDLTKAGTTDVNGDTIKLLQGVP